MEATWPLQSKEADKTDRGQEAGGQGQGCSFVRNGTERDGMRLVLEYGLAQEPEGKVRAEFWTALVTGGVQPCRGGRWRPAPAGL